MRKETDCAMLEVINSERENPIQKCPFDDICTGVDCKLTGQVPPPDLEDDRLQESALRKWILDRIRKN